MDRIQQLLKDNRITIIGVTGGVGSGKSKIVDYIEEAYNAITFKADIIGHKVMEKGSFCHEQIIREFGRGILDGEGGIDRNKLSAIVFNNEEKLGLMNGIIHPAVENYIINQILDEYNKYGHRLFVIEAALLIEAGYKKICTQLWYVYSDKKLRINRLENSRGYSYEKCLSIMSNQLSEEEFRKNCDCVINNGKDFNNTKNQIEKYMDFCYNNNID